MRPLFKFVRDRNRSPAEVYDLLEVLVTRAITETPPQVWTPALLEKRQRAKLAARAAYVWRSDLA